MTGEGQPDDLGSPVSNIVPADEWSDPYPRYHRMRAENPVHPTPDGDGYILTRFDECERVLRDFRFSADAERHSRRARPRIEAAASVDTKTLLELDPPDHTRLRSLVSKAFTPRTVERLRPHVAELVAEFLDTGLAKVADGGTFDVIADLGSPLPTTVICELLGVPVEDRDLFGPWSAAATRTLDGGVKEEVAQRALEGMLQIVDYMDALFGRRRREPRDDLISALLAVEEEGDRLTEAELQATVVLLFIAGHETTTNLIGNGTVALLRHRDQWDRLVHDPGLTAPAVEELLRYDGPVHATAPNGHLRHRTRRRHGRAGTRGADASGRGQPRPGPIRGPRPPRPRPA